MCFTKKAHYSWSHDSSRRSGIAKKTVTNFTDALHQSVCTNLVIPRYSPLGRIENIIGPNEKDTGNLTLRFDYHPEGSPGCAAPGASGCAGTVPYALTQHFDVDAEGHTKASGTIDTILFTDGLKRVLQTKKAASVLEGNAALDRMIVSGRLVFDEVGRTIRQFYPTTEGLGQGPSFNPIFDASAPLPTVTDYDALDRVTRITIPDGSFTTMSYGFNPDRAGANQFETVVTDANVNALLKGAVKRTYRDARELITAVKEVNKSGVETIWTSYAYDPLKQITQVVDDKLNTTTITYDNLGRRTVIENPDTGKTEPQYGKLGETVYEKKTVTTFTNATHPSVYETRFSFDTFGRMLRITYPDGEVVTNTYDPGGNLRSAEGVKAQAASGQNHRYRYLQGLFYDKFEQRVLLEQGNNVKTAYSYDAKTRRLASLTAQKNSGELFQNLAYSYDKVGNILGLANNVAVPPPNVFGGPTNQSFAYDDL